MCCLSENLELITLVWLDKSVDSTEENRIIQQKIRSIHNFLKTFDNTNDFQDFLQNEINLKYDRIILIVSGQLGKEIIENIHQLTQIISILVFCQNKQLNQLWANKYSKIKNVIVELTDLLNEIQNQIKSDELLISERIDLIEDRNEIVELIYQIESTIPDRRDLLNFCFNYLKNNLEKSKEIHEFEHFYSSEKCFDWFSNQTFLYQLLKRSFQLFDIQLIYLLRFFFQDLDQQIDDCSTNCQIFFKGQLMTIDQIEFLTNLNENQQFVFQNYLIVNSNEEKIVHSLTNINYLNGLHKVLFRIESKKKFIKNVKDLFLFPLLTSFRKISMKLEKRMWIIHIQVANQKIQFNQIKQPIDLPIYLKHQLLFDEAKNIYSLLSKQNPVLSCQCYHGIASIHELQGDYCNALDSYGQAMECLSKDHLDYDHYLNHIGSMYDYLNDYPNALDYYFQALKLIKNKKIKIKVLNNIGITYANLQQYDQALKYFQDCLNLLNEYQFNHLDYISNNLGLVYFYLKQYDKSFESFSLAFKSVQSNRSKAILLQNLAVLFEKTDRFEESLKSYQQSLEIFNQCKPIHHPSISFIQQQIQFIKQFK